MDYKTGGEYFRGVLLAAIFCAVYVVAFVLSGFDVGVTIVIGVLTFLVGLYTWCLNTYEEPVITKIFNAILLYGIPVMLLLSLLLWQDKGLLSSFDVNGSETNFVVGLVVIAIFSIAFVISIVFQKSGKGYRLHNYFLYVRIAQAIAVIIAMYFMGLLVEFTTALFILGFFVVRALLGLRMSRQFNLFDDDDAKAYLRKGLRYTLMDGMYLTLGMIMLAGIGLIIMLLILAAIGAVIEFIQNIKVY